MASQNPEPNPLPDYTDLPVGEILRRTRVHYNQTLEDVAGFMRIRASQLDAIERGEIDKLPGQVYAIGYVRTYSEYLGLDGEKMVQLFKQQSIGRTPRPELHFPVAASESKAPNFFVIFSSLAVLAVVIGGWMLISGAKNRSEPVVSEIPDVPSDMRVADVMGAQPPALPALTPVVPATTGEAALPQPMNAVSAAGAEIPAEPAAPAAAAAPAEADAAAVETETAATKQPPAAGPVTGEQKKEIVINVKERSWVEVRDKQGKPILSRILKPGEIFIVPEQNYGLRLDTGNAGGLELLVNGQKLPSLGKQGDILRGLVLDGNKLLQRLAPVANPENKPE